MALFKRKHKNGKAASVPRGSGSCGAGTNSEKTATKMETENARIKVLGSGCAKCWQLEAATKAALEQLGLDEQVGHVTDFAQIASYGVLSTPALVVNGKVVSSAKLHKTEEIVKILKAAMEE